MLPDGPESLGVIELFVDTNLFLQCQELSQLPWHEISDAQDVLVLVPRVVQQEVDRLKHDGKSRRAGRARRAASLFREAIEAPQLELILRQQGPRVALSFPPIPDPERLRSTQLDLARPDDRLIEEALAYRASNTGKDVRLLTNDTNAMLTARQCGLPYIAVPEHWLLDPEPDERDKALADALRRVAALERQSPDIKVHVEDADGTTIQKLRAEIDQFPSLPEDIVDAMVEEVRSLCLIAEAFEGHGLPLPSRRKHGPPFDMLRGHYVPPGQEDIDNYREVEYPRWIQEVRETFKRLPGLLEQPRRRLRLSFVLENSGVRPAENLVVELNALGGLKIAPPADESRADLEMSPMLPLPPSPPTSRYVPGFAESAPFELGLNPTVPFLESIASLHRQEDRDPHAFYWKGGRPSAAMEEWTLTCKEFRHQVEPERFQVVALPPSRSTIEKGALSFRVTASNLPEPVAITLPIAISRIERDTLEVARQILGAFASRRT
jgi:hypothetical protein